MSTENKKSGIFAKLKGIKNIELICVVLLCAVVLTVFFSTFSTDGGSASGRASETFGEYIAAQSERLAVIISKIKGAGKVEIMISYVSGIEYEYAYETKSQTVGGTTTTTSEIIYSQGKPVIVNEKAPKIKGVVVVAEGAGSASVRLEIVKAVQTLLSVSPGSIEVFAYGK